MRKSFQEMAAVQTIIKNDFYEVNGVTMVPLRLIAEKLGWTVTVDREGRDCIKG